MKIPIAEPDRSQIRQPPPGANTLHWNLFKEEGDSWFLAVPPYYAWLFGFLHPQLMTWHSNTGWRETKSGKNMYAYFRGLNETDIRAIRSFIDALKRHIVLGPKKALNERLGAGLDFCLALGRNYESPQHAATGQRTELGRLEYQAKYRECDESTACLAGMLHEAFALAPAPEVESVCLTYIPPGPSKRDRFYVPRAIAHNLAHRLRADNKRVDLVECHLRRGKRPMKDLTFEQKIAEWQRIGKKQRVELSSSVDNHVVYVVDDLYQSGTSLHAFAAYLKSKGASHVLGLVCVKSLSDTGNV